MNILYSNIFNTRKNVKNMYIFCKIYQWFVHVVDDDVCD